jgi:hypothetical protein
LQPRVHCQWRQDVKLHLLTACNLLNSARRLLVSLSTPPDCMQ